MTPFINAITASWAADKAEDQRQLEAFRANPPHFLTVSAKD